MNAWRGLVGCAVVLLAGCGAIDRPGEVATTPTGTATRPAPTAMPTPDGVIRSQEGCERLTGRVERAYGVTLQMSPAAPRGGDRVTLDGADVARGIYVLVVWTPGPDIETGVDRVTVMSDGLHVTFTMPPATSGDCLVVRAGGYFARPFLVP